MLGSLWNFAALLEQRSIADCAFAAWDRTITMRSLLSVLALGSLVFAGPGAFERPQSLALSQRQADAYPAYTIDQPVDHFLSDAR